MFRRIEDASPMSIVLPPTARPSLRRLLETLFVWIALARSRRDLAALDDRALRDIGIDRATAAEESAKPFWRSV